MIYIFTFLGEFGYELLNWQGVIRKFSKTLRPSDKLICCSRGDLSPLYEMADVYIDISKVKTFERGVSCAYYALASPVYNFKTRMNTIFAQQLKAKLRSFILRRLKATGPLDRKVSWWKVLFEPGRATVAKDLCRFIFSSERTELNGCVFGARCSPYDPEYDIYDYLDLDNNIYRKIEPDLSIGETVEKKLGWGLDEPFILCQSRKRSERVPAGSKDTIPSRRLIKPLAKKTKVVLLSFRTTRKLDSHSEFEDLSGAYLYPCQSFTEQICLIHFARGCIFFTEGDFGSHIYLPPLLGKDVVAIAPWSVHQLGTSPIDFWNRGVFRFGGKIIPLISEEVFASENSITSMVKAVLYT